MCYQVNIELDLAAHLCLYTTGTVIQCLIIYPIGMFIDLSFDD